MRMEEKSRVHRDVYIKDIYTMEDLSQFEMDLKKKHCKKSKKRNRSTPTIAPAQSKSKSRSVTIKELYTIEDMAKIEERFRRREERKKKQRGSAGHGSGKEAARSGNGSGEKVLKKKKTDGMILSEKSSEELPFKYSEEEACVNWATSGRGRKGVRKTCHLADKCARVRRASRHSRSKSNCRKGSPNLCRQGSWKSSRRKGNKGKSRVRQKVSHSNDHMETSPSLGKRSTSKHSEHCKRNKKIFKSRKSLTAMKNVDEESWALERKRRRRKSSDKEHKFRPMANCKNGKARITESQEEKTSDFELKHKQPYHKKKDSSPNETNWQLSSEIMAVTLGIVQSKIKIGSVESGLGNGNCFSKAKVDDDRKLNVPKVSNLDNSVCKTGKCNRSGRNYNLTSKSSDNSEDEGNRKRSKGERTPRRDCNENDDQISKERKLFLDRFPNTSIHYDVTGANEKCNHNENTREQKGKIPNGNCIGEFFTPEKELRKQSSTEKDSNCKPNKITKSNECYFEDTVFFSNTTPACINDEGHNALKSMNEHLQTNNRRAVHEETVLKSEKYKASDMKNNKPGFAKNNYPGESTKVQLKHSKYSHTNLSLVTNSKRNESSKNKVEPKRFFGLLSNFLNPSENFPVEFDEDKKSAKANDKNCLRRERSGDDLLRNNRMREKYGNAITEESRPWDEELKLVKSRKGIKMKKSTSSNDIAWIKPLKGKAEESENQRSCWLGVDHCSNDYPKTKLTALKKEVNGKTSNTVKNIKDISNRKKKSSAKLPFVGQCLRNFYKGVLNKAISSTNDIGVEANLEDEKCNSAQFETHRKLQKMSRLNLKSKTFITPDLGKITKYNKGDNIDYCEECRCERISGPIPRKNKTKESVKIKGDIKSRETVKKADVKLFHIEKNDFQQHLKHYDETGTYIVNYNEPKDVAGESRIEIGFTENKRLNKRADTFDDPKSRKNRAIPEDKAPDLHAGVKSAVMTGIQRSQSNFINSTIGRILSFSRTVLSGKESLSSTPNSFNPIKMFKTKPKSESNDAPVQDVAKNTQKKIDLVKDCVHRARGINQSPLNRSGINGEYLHHQSNNINSNIKNKIHFLDFSKKQRFRRSKRKRNLTVLERAKLNQLYFEENFSNSKKAFTPEDLTKTYSSKYEKLLSQKRELTKVLRQERKRSLKTLNKSKIQEIRKRESFHLIQKSNSSDLNVCIGNQGKKVDLNENTSNKTEVTPTVQHDLNQDASIEKDSKNKTKQDLKNNQKQMLIQNRTSNESVSKGKSLHKIKHSGHKKHIKEVDINEHVINELALQVAKRLSRSKKGNEALIENIYKKVSKQKSKVNSESVSDPKSKRSSSKDGGNINNCSLIEGECPKINDKIVKKERKSKVGTNVEARGHPSEQLNDDNFPVENSNLSKSKEIVSKDNPFGMLDDIKKMKIEILEDIKEVRNGVREELEKIKEGLILDIKAGVQELSFITPPPSGESTELYKSQEESPHMMESFLVRQRSRTSLDRIRRHGTEMAKAVVGPTQLPNVNWDEEDQPDGAKKKSSKCSKAKVPKKELLDELSQRCNVSDRQSLLPWDESVTESMMDSDDVLRCRESRGKSGWLKKLASFRKRKLLKNAQSQMVEDFSVALTSEDPKTAFSSDAVISSLKMKDFENDKMTFPLGKKAKKKLWGFGKRGKGFKKVKQGKAARCEVNMPEGITNRMTPEEILSIMSQKVPPGKNLSLKNSKLKMLHSSSHETERGDYLIISDDINSYKFLLSLGFLEDSICTIQEDSAIISRLDTAINKIKLGNTKLLKSQGLLIYMLAVFFPEEIMKCFGQIVEAIINNRIKSIEDLTNFICVLKQNSKWIHGRPVLVSGDSEAANNDNESINGYRTLFNYLHFLAKRAAYNNGITLSSNSNCLLARMVVKFSSGLEQYLPLLAHYIGQEIISDINQLTVVMTYLTDLKREDFDQQKFEVECGLPVGKLKMRKLTRPPLVEYVQEKEALYKETENSAALPSGQKLNENMQGFLF